MTTGLPRITLRVAGIGAVPSFKNNKMIARGRLITNPKRQQWMESCTRAFVSQLLSLTRTIGDATWTVQQQRCSIASSLPEDDSWQWVPEIRITAQKVSKGNEGATILIEQL